MTRMLALSLAAVLATLAGCSSDDDSGRQAGPLQPLRTIALAYNLQAVSGHGRVVAALDYNGDRRMPAESPFQAILYLAERHPDRTDELLDLGTLVLDAAVGSAQDLSVTADWVTVSCDGTLSLVSLAGASPVLVATVSASASTRAIASGRWLLQADGTALRVRDLAVPETVPQVGETFEAGAPVTGLAIALDGFYVFTSAGIGHVSMQTGTPQYAHSASDDLRLLSKAHLHGTTLYAGGPSPLLGKVRLARIDVSTYAGPVLEASVDVEGLLEDFAWDGAGAFVVLVQTPDHGTQRVIVARESGGAIVPEPARDLPSVLRGSGGIAHAWEGVLYAPYMSSPYVMTLDTLALFALP